MPTRTEDTIETENLKTNTAQLPRQYTPEDIIIDDNNAETSNTIFRVVVIAIDQSNYSHLALDWAMKNILRRESDLVKTNAIENYCELNFKFYLNYFNYSKKKKSKRLC